MRHRIAFATFILLAMAGTAGAASNLALMGGAMFPVGDFADATDISPYGGARIEFQDVNARGQTAVISYLAWGGFGLLLPDPDVEAALEAAGQDTDGTYFDFGIGGRVYTRSALFVGAGASYVNLSLPGPGDSLNGIGFIVELGLSFDRESFKFEIEGRGNAAFLEDSNDFQNLQALAAIGFPF
jgi:hypothetical protein